MKTLDQSYKRATTKVFGAEHVSWNSGTSINISCTTHKRRAPPIKIFVFFFSKILFKLYLKNESLTDAHKQDNFFQNQRIFCLFSRKDREGFPSHPASCAPKLIYFLKRGWYSTNFFFMTMSKFSKTSL